MAFFNRKKKDEEIESQSCGCQRPKHGLPSLSVRPCRSHGSDRSHGSCRSHRSDRSHGSCRSHGSNRPHGPCRSHRSDRSHCSVNICTTRKLP